MGQDLPSAYPPEGDRSPYYLTFSPAESTDYTTAFPDRAARDSIQSQYPNRYRGSKAVEAYALKHQDIDFLRRVTTPEGPDQWVVDLLDGESFRLHPTEVHSRIVDLTFQYYYEDHALILFRSHWREGGGSILVSRRDGQTTRTFGPPLFSPSGKWIITFNEDTISGYSPNGVQLFSARESDVTEILSYRIEPRIGGPTAAKWISDRRFRLKMVSHNVQDEGPPTEYSHFSARIREEK